MISTDPPEVTAAFRTGLGATYTFLSDHERRAISALDIVETTAPGFRHGHVAVPYTFSLLPDLTIHRIYNGYWFWGRPSVVDLWHDLRAVTSEIRPDWDLSSPGLREAWNAGDLSRFHGWNKGAKAFRVGRKEER